MTGSFIEHAQQCQAASSTNPYLECYTHRIHAVSLHSHTFVQQCILPDRERSA